MIGAKLSSDTCGCHQSLKLSDLPPLLLLLLIWNHALTCLVMAVFTSKEKKDTNIFTPRGPGRVGDKRLKCSPMGGKADTYIYTTVRRGVYR